MKKKTVKKFTNKKKTITALKRFEILREQIDGLKRDWMATNSVLTRHETQHKDILYIMNLYGQKYLEGQNAIFNVLSKMTDQLFFLEKQNNMHLNILKDISLALLKQQGLVDEVEEKENSEVVLDETSPRSTEEMEPELPSAS